MAFRFADLHCHPSMKAYSRGIVNFNKAINDTDARDKRSIWHTNSYFGDRWREELEKLIGVAKYSQSNMTRLEDGNANLIVLSITPPEVGFFQPNHNKLPRFLRAFQDDAIINLVTEFGRPRAWEIQSANYDYFNDLNREYDYVLQLDDMVSKRGKKYRIARRGENIKTLMDQNPETVIVVLSIEGGHSLISNPASTSIIRYTPYVDDLNHPLSIELMEMLEKNILVIKGWGGGVHCPLFITLAHHFWNLLTGHALSLANLLTDLLNQKEGVNRNITAVGKRVVELLLSTNNGKRILIDTRHMSVAARLWYYDYIDQYNALNPIDQIPIISSHSAANDNTTIDGSEKGEIEKLPDGDSKILGNEKYRESSIFNNWSINLSDEEIIRIYNSGGIIGISFDQRVLSGNQLQVRLSRTRDQKYWALPFYNQIRKIYNLIFERNGGDSLKAIGLVCLGSDFDGIINPLDFYNNSKEFNSLQQQLFELISEQPLDFPGITAQEVVDSVMFNSALKFIEKCYK